MGIDRKVLLEFDSANGINYARVDSFEEVKESPWMISREPKSNSSELFPK